MADLFLSYHSADREAVRTAQRLLELRGVSTFLDRDRLVRGLPFPAALEDGLRTCRGVAVFVGPELGSWQKRELWAALDRQVAEERQGRRFPVVPVLLPGAEPGAGFLFLNTWVDLRAGIETASEIDALVGALVGEVAPPAAAASSSIDSGVCPYRGLYAFREEDAPFLRGREEAINQLVAKVTTSRLAVVVGSSGCGKSSVVMAGLVPRLRRQRPPNMTWDVVSFTPGRTPLRRFARSVVSWLEPDSSPVDLAKRAEELGEQFERGQLRPAAFVDEGLRKSGAERLILIVDQFEELFTETPMELRRPFARFLIDLLQECPVVPVITIRADFFGFAIDLDQDLKSLIDTGSVTIGPLRREELRRAIVEPAREVGLSFDPPLLVDKLLDDVGDEPGNLPLLEFALTELWTGRRNGQLLGDTYAGFNGVAGAIAARADAELRKLGDVDAVRRLMTSLVRTAPSASGIENTRRRAVLADLDESARVVITAFSRQTVRLLVTSRDEAGRETVEVAHEALIGAWAQLQHWLARDLELRLWRQRLEPSLDYWIRDQTNVLGGLLLAEAEKWLHERGPDLRKNEIHLIRSSLAKRDQILAEQRAREQHELQMARQLAETGQARAAAEENARIKAEALALSEKGKSRRTRVLAACIGCLFVVAFAFALRANSAQRQAKASLDEVVRSLWSQLEGDDANLRLAAIEQLVTIVQPGELKNILASVPEYRFSDNRFVAEVRLVLEQTFKTNSQYSQLEEAGFRNFLTDRVRVARRNGYMVPPLEQEERLNARIWIAGGRIIKSSGPNTNDSGMVSSFQIQEHEVTNAEYQRFDTKHPGGLDDHPVTMVSWYDAMAYATWLGGILPTEEQWEFAARGSSGRPYPWGEAPPSCGRANRAECGGRLDRVKAREEGKTPEGVYDLEGNVSEWCFDRTGHMKIFKGQAYRDTRQFTSEDKYVRLPDEGHPAIGFRVAFAPPD